MLNNNPFSLLAEAVSPLAMQGFIIVMFVGVVGGSVVHRSIEVSQGFSQLWLPFS